MKLGEFLRSERLQKGITLEEAAEETRIKETYLRAIEEDNYSLIPGEIYQRHYVKTYLEYLGHEDLYYRLTREKPKPAHLSDKMVREPTADTWDTGRYLRVILRLAVLVLFIAVLIALASMGISRMKSREKSTHIADDVIEELQIPLPLPPAQDEVEAAIIEALGPSADLGDVDAQIEGGLDTHTVRVDVNGECWVSVSGSSGGIIFKGLLNEGDSKTFGPERHFIITLGKPENAWVYFDNVHIYGGDLGQPPDMTFSLPADIKLNKDILINPLEDVTGGN